METFKIGSPASLLSTVPALLGFAPDDLTLVVIGIEPGGAAVHVTMRYDLAQLPFGNIAGMVAHTTAVLAAQHVERACAVGYGPDEIITPVAAALITELALSGIALRDFLRAEDGRYWSYMCTNPECCSPEGTPFTVSVPAELTNNPILASRAEMAASIAAVTGPDAARMLRALKRAEERAEAMPRRAVIVNLAAVRQAIDRYRTSGQAMNHDEAATLAVALRRLRIRDDAWSRMDPEHRAAHVRLWTDLTRLTSGAYVAAPASLLAFVAWQNGNGALANVALDRALAADPEYTMANLLRQVINAGAPPSLATLPMTPEDVAASYDAQKTEGEDK